MTTPITQAARGGEKPRRYSDLDALGRIADWANNGTLEPERRADLLALLAQIAADQKVIEGLQVNLYEAEQRLHKAEWILERQGYRRCDIAACNCGGYHK